MENMEKQNNNDDNLLYLAEIAYYQDIYNGLTSGFSPAYLKGSSFYIGESIHDWLFTLSKNSKEMEKKLSKWEELKILLDTWIQTGNY